MFNPCIFKKSAKGFTLIELLIVVAIIAILAAIAVPNFLEAQTRSKISRAQADMRTIATAQEAYIVDNNRPTIGRVEDVLLHGNMGPGWRWSFLTTPIAYLSSIPSDPFLDRGMFRKAGANSQNEYNYEAYQTKEYLNPACESLKGKGFSWSLHSFGPLRRYSYDASSFQNVERVLDGRGFPTVYPNTFYDPTNGTLSFGWLIRTNRGVEPASKLK